MSTTPSKKSSNGGDSSASASIGSASLKDFGGLDPENSVTPRQLECLALYASGYTIEHIGRVKFLSTYTVQNYLKTAVKRSGARSLTHLCTSLVDAHMIRLNAQQIYEPVQDLRIVGE